MVSQYLKLITIVIEYTLMLFVKTATLLTFTYSKSAIEIVQKGVKYGQS